VENLPLEQIYPGWKDEHGVVHIVGLHTNNRLYTECCITIVNSSNVWVQLRQYEPCYEPPNCLECLVNFEPF
jgi:hypothetical protein